MSDYHFGIPSIAIWLSHIIFGLYFIYLGYNLINLDDFKIHGMILSSMGVLMLSYHAHLWYLESTDESI